MKKYSPPYFGHFGGGDLLKVSFFSFYYVVIFSGIMALFVPNTCADDGKSGKLVKLGKFSIVPSG